MNASEQQLRQAFALMKQGKKQDATQIIQEVLRQDRSNYMAWWMFANLQEDSERQAKALEKVLELNPQHAGALALLSKLKPNSPLVANYTPPKPEPAKPKNSAPQKNKNDDEKKKSLSSVTYDENEEETARLKKERDTRLVNLVFGIGGGTFLLVLLVLVFFSMGGLTAFDSGPQTTLDQYYAAFSSLDFERMASLSCATDAPTIQELAQGMNALGRGNELTIDTSKLVNSKTTVTSDRVTFTVSGELSFASSGVTLTFTIDELAERMGAGGIAAEIYVVRENGTWLVCSQ